MFLTTFEHLTWAYQLHYQICFRTHRRRNLFDGGLICILETQLNRLASENGYHILEMKVQATDVQLILSLRPEHCISDVLKKLKGRSSAALCALLKASPPLWARGYLARSTGKMRVQAVKQYLEKQAEHHGYHKRHRPPVFRFRANKPTELRVAHASFDLKHHLVLATQYRHGVFDSVLGKALIIYWQKVAGLRNFAIDQATVVPDHVHALLRITPKVSIEEVTLCLMNNSQHFVSKNYPERLIQGKMTQLWQPSAYAGTCGELTTALLKAFLRRAEWD